jgi:2-polyprenyl-6-hydroxyphenyl methylase/3-demethylubiquinone-9 3-methyltransferase
MPANVDAREIAKFEALARSWWDPAGDSRALHDINPVRLGYIEARCPLAGCRVLDVGCGGGILSEAMARAGARVTAIDMGEAPLAVARLHAIETGTEVDYRLSTAESLAAESPGAYDLVTCLEMLEHVPDPSSIVSAAARLVRPGGHVVFSTINRNPKAWALAVVAAEYVLQLLPRGTHDYAKFITPAELARACRGAGLDVCDVTGMTYNPLTHRASLADDVDVNYLLHARRPDVP